MCRFTLYLGPRLPLRRFLFESEHSLVLQSSRSAEREDPLNGDGFGIGWYARGLSDEPAVFRSITPAWNNRNLMSLARVVESDCVVAHVRAATNASGVNESNCHPFRWGRYLFAHNGDLAGFRKLRRSLLESVGDAAFHNVYGSTDSEHLFALVIDELERASEPEGAARLAAALDRALGRALELAERFAPGEPSWLNFVLSDGDHAVACRYSTDREHGPESLYLYHGRNPEPALGRTVDDRLTAPALFVSSERLSGDPGWQAVPPGHLVVVARDQMPSIVPCLSHAGARRGAA
jgi:predicted glutamine amidotransferase